MSAEVESELNRVQPRSLRQQVATLLRADILRGKYLPGDRIIEVEVASSLKVSRGPVREAIRQLEAEGLVVYSNNKGCTVITLDPQDAWEIYVLRADLECLALSLCNGAISAAALDEMEQCITRMELSARTNDMADIIEQDHRFHGLICKASNSKRLYTMWSSLNGTSYAIFHTVLSEHVGSPGEMAPKHRTVLEKLRTGDLATASQGVRDHYLGTGRNLFKMHGESAPG